MSENEQPQTEGKPPEQTATGEIKDQSPTTPETKVETKPDGKPSILNEKEPSGAPEKYSDFKVPDDYTLDPAVLGEATTLFKKHGFSQETAQELVDFYAARSLEAADGPVKFYQDIQKKWDAELRADPNIGGKMSEVKTTVGRALDLLGDPKLAADFREAMDYTGAGNNPAFVRTFYALARKLTEGGHVGGGKPAPEPQHRPRTPAQAMYPDLPSSTTG